MRQYTADNKPLVYWEHIMTSAKVNRLNQTAHVPQCMFHITTWELFFDWMYLSRLLCW
jgi:hypothetical protein